MSKKCQPFTTQNRHNGRLRGARPSAAINESPGHWRAQGARDLNGQVAHDHVVPGSKLGFCLIWIRVPSGKLT